MVYCTGKLSNRFRLIQVDVHTIRLSLWTHPNSIHSSVTDKSSRSRWIAERNTTSACLICCLKKLTFTFSSTGFLALAVFYYKQWKSWNKPADGGDRWRELLTNSLGRELMNYVILEAPFSSIKNNMSLFGRLRDNEAYQIKLFCPYSRCSFLTVLQQ